ncbi:hypothetical protein Purlil1_4106 [Purpureocillium lilacinum]|uniref:Uncharacterized protein n=1 Tax=Purpureocillium lilacinum TaxID=33203 RepID=A0ABR0C5L4_PURLI|nr:hypothetical protein Purlil1_4106 [Purpureocillium lilacinum]
MNCIFEFLQRRICCESGTVSDGRVGAEGVGDDHVGVEARESRLPRSRECLLPTRSVATPDLFASPSLASPTPNSFPIAASARRTHSQQPIKPSQRPSRRQLPPLGVSLVDIRVNSAVNRSQPPVSPTASICMQPAQRGERDSGDPLSQDTPATLYAPHLNESCCRASHVSMHLPARSMFAAGLINVGASTPARRPASTAPKAACGFSPISRNTGGPADAGNTQCSVSGRRVSESAHKRCVASIADPSFMWARFPLRRRSRVEADRDAAFHAGVRLADHIRD